jgi:hypothetical protein
LLRRCGVGSSSGVVAWVVAKEEVLDKEMGGGCYDNGAWMVAKELLCFQVASPKDDVMSRLPKHYLRRRSRQNK